MPPEDGGPQFTIDPTIARIATVDKSSQGNNQREQVYR
jgi:hypothetical protein